jgi:hypothetical protein
MAGESKTTTKHTEIKRWVEARGGRPASVAGTERENEAGVLRKANDLAFLYQDRTANGQKSRFFKFVHR